VVYEDQGLLEVEEEATVAAHQVAPELDAMKVRRNSCYVEMESLDRCSGRS
jgi:hypothetical protein